MNKTLTTTLLTLTLLGTATTGANAATEEEYKIINQKYSQAIREYEQYVEKSVQVINDNCVIPQRAPEALEKIGVTFTNGFAWKNGGAAWALLMFEGDSFETGVTNGNLQIKRITDERENVQKVADEFLASCAPKTNLGSQQTSSAQVDSITSNPTSDTGVDGAPFALYAGGLIATASVSSIIIRRKKLSKKH